MIHLIEGGLRPKEERAALLTDMNRAVLARKVETIIQFLNLYLVKREKAYLNQAIHFIKRLKETHENAEV